MDISRFIDSPLYWIITLIIERLWGVNRYLMLAALQIDQLNEWLVANAGDLLDIVAAAAQTPAMLAVGIAITLYGLWRVLSTLLPDMIWKPVDLTKVIVYLIGMSLFFSAPAATLVAVDQVRTNTAAGLQADIFSTLSIDLAPAGFTSSEPPIPLSGSVTTTTGAVGVRLASSVLLVATVDEYGSKTPPQTFLDTFIPNDSYEFENLSPDDRSDALGVASTGLGLYTAAPMIGFFALAEVLLWTILNIAVLILWIGLPIALIFSPFTASEGIFKTFVHRYVGVIIETFVSVVLMGIVNTALIYAGTLGLGMLVATILLSMVVVGWRIFSALKLARSAIDTIGGANVTGGMTISQGAGQVAKGAAAVAGLGVAAVGGTALGLTYAGGVGKNRGEAAEAQYQSHMNTSRRIAAAGGYLMGHSSTASKALGHWQGARLITGMHNPARDGSDATDAAYLGSRLSGPNGSSAAYMTAALMGGPNNAFQAMGYPVSGMGMQNGNAGVDEDGNAFDLNGGGNGSSANMNGRQGMTANRSASRNGSPSSNGYSDLPKNDWTSDAGRNLYGGSGDNGSTGQSDATASDLPVDFNSADSGHLNNWVETVEKNSPSESRRNRVVSHAKANYHPAAGDVADMVDHYGSDGVNSGIKAIQNQVAAYKQQGMSNGQILDAFNNGQAFDAIEEAEDTELSRNRSDMATLAAFTLRPTSNYSGQQIISTLGQAIDDPSVETPSQVNGFVNAQMGTDSNLGSYTGPGRGVVSIARDMGVNGAQVQNAYQMYSAGDTKGAWSELAAGTNSSSQNISRMMNQFKAIPSTATMARSTKAIPLPPASAAPTQVSPPIQQSVEVEMQQEVIEPVPGDTLPDPPEFSKEIPQ